MNLDNRRLKEIQAEKIVWSQQLDKCSTISDCLGSRVKSTYLKKKKKKYSGDVM